MEPIGAIASVLGIATAAVKISQALHDILIKIRDAPDEIRRLSEDLQSISSILSSLETTLKERNDQQVLKGNKAIVCALKDLKAPLQRCTKDIKDLKSKIAPCLGLLERGKGYRLKTKWWFHSNAIKSLIASFESAKQTLNIGMSNVSMACNLRDLPVKQNAKSTKPVLWRSNSTDTDAGFALRRYIAASTTATQNDPEDSTADNPLELDSNADESDEAVDSVKYNPFQSASLDTDAGLASEANTVALTTLPNEELSSSQNSGVLRLAGGRGRLIQPFARPITKSFRVAVCDGVISEVREFLDDGVNPNAFSLEGYTPLWYAASLGLKDIVALLLSAGADPDLHSENPSYKPLFIAIKNQHVAVAHLLIDGGANIGVGPLRKRTALHQAVASEVLDIAKVLIDRGAEIDAVSDDVIIATPLCVAVWTCNSVLIDMLLDAGANPRVQTPDHKTALHVVAMKGSREVAAKIFAADKQRNPGPEQAILDMKDMNGLTALGLAICWNNVPVIDTLLHAGANPEDAKLFTDLHIASILGHPSIAAIPLDAVSQRDPDAEPEMKDGWGYTALHWAACNVRFEYVKLLLERGASTSSKSKSGRTPLQCAKGADAKGR